jgi:hypothetical protein
VSGAEHRPELVEPDAEAVVHVGYDHAIHFYSDGSARFAHECDRGERGLVRCAPLLQLDGGHQIVTRYPLTIRPSILCGDCGTHGFITDGRWTDV